MPRYRRTLVALIATLTLTLTAACSGSGPSASASRKPDKVTYLTAFGAVGRDAFAWVAQDKGYFKAAGLDVSIQLGAATDTNLKLLDAGKAQFAALDLVGATIDVGNGKYTDTRAFAAIHQRNLSSIITPEGSGIVSPHDLIGKRIGTATGGVGKLLFPAYARLAGIDPNSVHWAEAPTAQLPTLLAAHQVDALATFLIGTPAIEKVTGKKSVVLPYSAYLTNLYGNALFTTGTFARAHADVVRRFRDAALKALAYTIAHPDEAGQILHKYNAVADAGTAAGEIRLMTPYVEPSSTGTAIGTIDQQRMASGIEILHNTGLFPAGLTPSGIVDFGLTPSPS